MTKLINQQKPCIDLFRCVFRQLFFKRKLKEPNRYGGVNGPEENHAEKRKPRIEEKNKGDGEDPHEYKCGKDVGFPMNFLPVLNRTL